jgi:hypothetical protein
MTLVQITKSLDPKCPYRHITSLPHVLAGKTDIKVTHKLLERIALLVWMPLYIRVLRAFAYYVS